LVLRFRHHFTGWAYETLSETATAKALAQQIVTEFIAQPQSDSGRHSTPKTLSLVDTELPFRTLLNVTNELLGIMVGLLHDPDPHFFAHLHRARSQAVTYAKEYSVDLGSLLSEIAILCNPEPDSRLAITANAVNEAYESTFVARGFGPGTVEGTGMLFDLPLVNEYNMNPALWENVLFLKDDHHAMREIPNYSHFFTAYTAAKQSSDSVAMTTKSVCRNRAAQTFVEEAADGTTILVQPLPSTGKMRRSFFVRGIAQEKATMTNPGAEGLLFDPQVSSDTSTGAAFIKTGVQMDATNVNAYYGLNVTNLLPHFQEAHTQAEKGGARKVRRKLDATEGSPTIRSAKEDFVILYGGKTPGQFVSSEGTMEWRGVWDRQFVVIKEGRSGDEFHLIFVNEPENPGTNNAKQVDVIFFPDYNEKIRQDMAVRIGTPVAAAIHPGGEYAGSNGYMEIVTDPATGKDTFTLYEIHCKLSFLGQESCGVRQPIGGFVAPVIPIRGQVNGNVLDNIVGGPSGKVLDWNSVDEWSIQFVPQTLLQTFFQAGSVVIELEATSADEGETDLRSFDVTEIKPAVGEGNVNDTRNEVALEASSPTTTPHPEEAAGPDIARCKPAIQSTTLDGNVARQALTEDMNLLANTQCEERPWWMVDLLSSRPILSVLLVNRRDCCVEGLNGVVVQLLDENDRMVAFVQHNPATDGPIDPSWRASFEGKTARKIRVSIERPEGECDYLALASVQVFSDQCTERDSCNHEGPGCDYGNVALCKAATQSSTLVLDPIVDPTGKTHGAWRATDGTLTLAHTTCEEDPWWELDLMKARAVTEVVIKNREDCCFERLNGLKVELFNQFNQLTGFFERK
jgi:hypothetical protein